MTCEAFYRFFRAWVIAIACSAGPIMVISVPFGLYAWPEAGLKEALSIAAFPALVAAGPALAGMVLVALPATVILSENPPERRVSYVKVGAVAGFIAPTVLGLIFYGSTGLVAGGFFGLFGTLAGLGAGLSWGGYREDLFARRHQADVFTDSEDSPANPIHDLLF